MTLENNFSNKVAVPKKYKIIFRIATGIILLWEGLMPLATLLFAPEYVNAGTKPLGYPDYFAYALIICKLLGSATIMIPKFPAKLKEWAYAGLTFELLFAAYSHGMVDGIFGFVLMPIAVLLILAVSYFYKNKIA